MEGGRRPGSVLVVLRTRPRRRDRHAAAPEQRPSRLRVSLGLDRWLHDLRLAIRVLRKDRGFTLTAIVTLTICLGGHAAIVAGVNGCSSIRCTVPEADRVLLMANQYPAVENRWSTTSGTPDYDDRLRHVTVMEEQALYNYSGMTIEIGGVPTRALGIVGTPSLLRLLRARPAHGRLFVDSEATPGNDQSIILSDRLFREKFNGDPAAVGRTLRHQGASSRSSACCLATSPLVALTFASGHHWR